MDLSEHLEQAVLGTPEELYSRLTGYAFAKRYLTGKQVADIAQDEIGYGSRLLAGTAGSVVGLSSSREAVERARALHPASNVRYESVDFLALPKRDDTFDAVVALQVIEHLESPEKLIKEAKRILKSEGVLIVSTPDKQARTNERNHPPYPSEMYVPELRELLERYFERVSMRRQGTVAGGFVSGNSELLSQMPVESARLSSTNPSLGSDLPQNELVIAICSDAEVPEDDERPYLLLDRDRRAFEEEEDHREDIELLRDEVQRMQDMEVQAFYNTLALRTSELEYLKAGLGLPGEADASGSSSNHVQELREQNEALKRENNRIKSRLHSIEGSNIWRLTAPYRRGKTLLDSWLKGKSKRGG